MGIQQNIKNQSSRKRATKETAEVHSPSQVTQKVGVQKERNSPFVTVLKKTIGDRPEPPLSKVTTCPKREQRTTQSVGGHPTGKGERKKGHIKIHQSNLLKKKKRMKNKEI